MNEELELCKAYLSDAENLEDIYHNPAVQIVKSILSLAPGVKDGLAAVAEAALKNFQHKKQTELFEIIFRDNRITKEDVSDVTVIMEFAKLLDVINRLSRNEKIQYFGNLMRGSIEEIKKGNVDEFEERLEKLASLSMREIRLLEMLYRCEEKSKIDEGNEDEKTEAHWFNYQKSWKLFIAAAKTEFSMNETDATSSIMSITRSGLCMFEWSAGLNNGGTMHAYTTPEYCRLRQMILDES